MKNNYRISIKAGDINFEIESTDAKWIEAKEKAFLQKIGKKLGGDEIESQDVLRQPAKANIPPQMTLDEFYRKYVHKIKSRPTIATFPPILFGKNKEERQNKNSGYSKLLQGYTLS